MTSYRALARNHDFSVLWIGQTVSELGTRISMFVFPLIAYAVTDSIWLASLVGTAELVGLSGALLPAGVLADRVDRRLLLRVSSGAGALAYASLTAAALLGTVTYAHLMAVALVAGLAAGLFSPAELSAVRTVVTREQLPTALSQNQARQHVAALVGAPIGGALYAVARWLPFAVDTVTYAISWVLLGRLRTDLSPATDPTSGRQTRRPVLADLREGTTYVARHPLFRTLTAWACLTNLTMNALFTVAVLRLVQDGVPPLHIGLVETAAGAAGILGALVAPWLIERLPTGWLTIAVSWSPLPARRPDGAVGSSGRRRRGARLRAARQPGGQRGNERLPHQRDPRPPRRAGPVGHPVRGDGLAATGPDPRRWPPGPARRPGCSAGGGRAVRPDRDHPHLCPIDPVGAEAGRLADRGATRARPWPGRGR